MVALTAMHERLHERLRERLARLRRITLLQASAFGVSMLGMLACGSDTTGPTHAASATMAWSLAFQWPAVNLALAARYDTAHVIAVPRTVTGSVLGDSIVVQYSTPDSAVSVNAAGLVTARYPTSGARVVARVTAQGVTLADTAIIQVTTTPPFAALDTLSIQPNPDDPYGLPSANMNLSTTGDTYWIPFYALTTTGDTVCNTDGCQGNYPLVVHYTSLDASIATIDQYGYLDPKSMGRVTIIASTLAYGVRKIDSLHASIGTPTFASIVDTVDNSQHLYCRNCTSSLTALPWSVGFRLGISNYTNGQLELMLPSAGHGVRFGGKPTQPKDTLAVPSANSRPFVNIFFDSVGTYTISHRLLSTGETYSQTYIIEPFP